MFRKRNYNFYIDEPKIEEKEREESEEKEIESKSEKSESEESEETEENEEMEEREGRGSMICGYSVEKELGSGTYGIVYKVKKDNIAYALKRFTMKYGQPLENAVLIELDILRSIKHPNLLHAIEIFFDKKGQICLILPLSKMDLVGFLKENPPNVDEPSQITIRMAYDLLCALDYLHTNHIIHGDIKLANILVDDNFNVKIADFGLSDYFIKDPLIYKFERFTLWWRPPEFLAADITDKKVKYKTEVDVWAMSIVLFQLFIGNNFYTGWSSIEVLREIAWNIGGLTVEQEEILFTYIGPDERKTLKNMNKQRISPRFKTLPDKYVRFILKGLIADPLKRPTARELLNDPIFSHINKCVPNVIEYEFFDLHFTESITQEYRVTLFEWLLEVNENNIDDTLFLAFDIFDRFFNVKKGPIRKGDIQMYGQIAHRLANELLLRGKVKRSFAYLKWLSNNAYTPQQFYRAEVEILSVLKFRLFRPTINIIFPNVEKEKLFRCYIRNIQIDEIQKCLS